MKEEMDIFLRNYRHLGRIYPAVPRGWRDIVVDAIIKIERNTWVQWLPLFAKGWIYDLSFKYSFFEWLKTKLSNGVYIEQIKEKFAELRIYGSYNGCDNIVDEAEVLCQRTCQNCSSMHDVKKTNSNWIKNLCFQCRNEQKLTIHPYMNLTQQEIINKLKKGEL